MTYKSEKEEKTCMGTQTFKQVFERSVRDLTDKRETR